MSDHWRMTSAPPDEGNKEQLGAGTEGGAKRKCHYIHTGIPYIPRETTEIVFFLLSRNNKSSQ